jgi:hypothetical protein
VATDRLGAGQCAHGALGRWSRVGCTRLAANQIGDAGVEALARALPPSLTTLILDSTCGPRLFAIALGLGMRCSAGLHVVRGAGVRPFWDGSAWRGPVRAWCVGLGRGSGACATWLAGNPIGDAGVVSLARALPPSLTEFSLGGTWGLGFFAAAPGFEMRLPVACDGRRWS